MPTIDERIVEMQFDNKDFEKNVGQSIKSLDALKKSLKFDDSYDSLDKFAKSVNKVDLSGIKNSIDDIGKHFTVVGRFIDRHIDGIIHSVESKLTGVLKSISVDQISAGMSKYETQTKAVQTITNATGKSVAEVEKVLGKLMKYTDETSYDFVEMANSIGKFTSVGVDLALAEKAMEGIANEAAVSGAGKAEANRAMYNFAQSLSAGKVQLIDWKSIENANMATKEFKEELIKTAIELGTITKTGETTGKIISGTGKKAKETAVDYKTFNQTLKDGWLTSDVLIKTLSRYANTSTDIGKKAFTAAQKALTFTDAMDAIKDAVSSQWMQSFKYMFGDLNESIDLWTNFCNAIIEVTSEIGEYRNALLEGWHEQGGYNAMIEAASNIWSAFVSVLHMVRDAFSKIFPPMTSEKLVEITEHIRDVTESWKKMFGYVEEQEVEEKIETITDAAEDMTDALEKGLRGDKVKNLQEQLLKAGYKLDKYGADGIFGPETQAALKALQKEVGVKETGVWDETTRKAVIASKKFQVVAEETSSAYKKIGDSFVAEEEYSQTVDYAKKITKTLKQGYTGSQVKVLQDQLVLLGYLDKAQADGVFGKGTENALKQLQKALGVEATGVWDKNTAAAVEAQKAFTVVETGIRKVSKTVGAQSTTMERLRHITLGVAAAINIFKSGLDLVGKVIEHVYNITSPLRNAFLLIGAVIGDCFVSLNDFLTESGFFDSAFAKIVEFLAPVEQFFIGLGDSITKFFELNPEISTFTELFSKLQEEFEKSEMKKTIDGWVSSIDVFLKDIGIDLPAIIEGLRVTFSTFGKFFSDLFSGKNSFKSFGDGWSALGRSLARSGNSMAKSIGMAMLKIKGKFRIILPVFEKTYETVKKLFGETFKKVLTVLVSVIPVAIGLIQHLAEAVGKFLGPKVQAAFEWFSENGPKAFEWVSGKLSSAIEAIREFGGSSIKFISETFSKVKNALTGEGPGLVEVAKETWNKIRDYLFGNNDDRSGDNNVGFIERLKNRIRNAIEAVKEAIRKKLRELYENNPAFKEFWDTYEGLFIKIDDFVRKVIGVIKEIPGWLAENVPKAVKSIKEFFGALIEGFRGFFTKDTSSEESPLDKLRSRLEEFEPVVDIFRRVIGKLKNAWETLINMGSKEAEEGGKKNGFVSVLDTIVGFFKSFGEFVGQNWKKLIIPAIGAVGAYVLVSSFKAIKNISKGFKGITDALYVKAGGKKDTGGDTALKIAESIGMIALAVGLLSIIDAKKAKEGLGVFTWVLAEMVAAMLLVGKLGGADNLGTQVMHMALSIGIIVASLWLLIQVLRGSTVVEIGQAIAIIAGFLLSLTFIEKAIAESATRSVYIGGILQMCIGLGLVVLSFAAMTAIVKRNGFWTLLGSTAIILALLGTLGAIEVGIAKFGHGKTKISGVLAMCAGLLLVAISFSKITKCVAEYGSSAWGAFVMIELLLITLGGLIALVNLTSKNALSSIAAAVEIVALGFTIKMVANAFADALVKIKDVDVELMKVFFIGVDASMGILATIVAVFGHMPLQVLFGSLGLVAVCAALAAGIELLAAVGADVLDRFGTAMWIVGSKLSDFDEMTKDMDIDHMKLVGDYIKNELAYMITTTATMAGKDLDKAVDFSSKLYTFGTNLGLYYASIESFDAEKIATAKTVVNDSVAIAKKIASIENPDAIENTLGKIGGALKLYYGNLAGLETEGVTVDSATIKQVFTALSDASPDTALVNTISAFATGGSSDLTDFAVGITNLGTALSNYGKDIGGINKDDVNNANSILETVQTLQTNLSQVTWSDLLGFLKGKRQDITSFGTDLAALGTAIGKYGESTKNLDDQKIKNAESVISVVGDLNNKLPTTGAVWQWVTGKKNLGEFASNMSTLGDGIAQYANKVSGANFTNSYVAMGLIGRIAEVFVSLDKHGGVFSWFTGDNDLSILSRGLVDVAKDFETLSSYTIDETVIDGFIGIVERVRDLQNSIDWENTNVTGLGQIAVSIKSALQELGGLNSMTVDTNGMNWGGKISLFDAIESGLQNTLNTMESMISTNTSLGTSMTELLGNVSQKVTDSNDTFSRKAQALMTAMSKAISNDYKVRNAFNSMLNAVVRVGSDKYDVFRALGIYLDAGIAKGIYEGENRAIEAAKDVVLAAYWAACNVVEVASPSKKFAEIGMYLDLGLVEGLRQYATNVKASAADSAAGAIEGAKGTLATFSSLIMDEIDDTPVIRPVLDLSNVAMGAAGLTGMFGTQTIGLQSAMLANRIAYARNEVPSVIYEGKNDNSNLNSTIEALNSRIDQLSQTISNMKVVTETGALIGEILPGIDKGLGKRAAAARRGG